MNRAESVKELFDDMGDNIHDEILSAFRAIEQLGIPYAELDSLLADRLLDILMDVFWDRFPELHSRAKVMYAAGGGKVPTPI